MIKNSHGPVAIQVAVMSIDANKKSLPITVESISFWMKIWEPLSKVRNKKPQNILINPFQNIKVPLGTSWKK